ncbi:MAG: D-Ala-D-Ala carboxypeptidase family metallohydrolase [Bacteroidota bacterium]
MNISKHITLLEATKSQTAIRNGIPNEPNEVQLEAMKLVAEACFEPIRNHFGIQLKVSSFFRCEALNATVGGSKTSQHCKGEAIDIDADGTVITNKQIFDWAKANLKFDQLILEYPDKDGNPAWVHISFSKHGNRNQVLTIK